MAVGFQTGSLDLIKFCSGVCRKERFLYWHWLEAWRVCTFGFSHTDFFFFFFHWSRDAQPPIPPPPHHSLSCSSCSGLQRRCSAVKRTSNVIFTKKKVHWGECKLDRIRWRMYLSKLCASAVCIVVTERSNSECVASSIWRQCLGCDSWGGNPDKIVQLSMMGSFFQCCKFGGV